MCGVCDGSNDCCADIAVDNGDCTDCSDPSTCTAVSCDEDFIATEAGGDDCDDDDPSTNPEASDAMGDDIDSNCNGRDSGCHTAHTSAPSALVLLLGIAVALRPSRHPS